MEDKKNNIKKVSKRDILDFKNSKGKRSLLGTRPVLKPYDYPWFMKVRNLQESLRWSHEEVSMSEDVIDWNCITPQEKSAITHIFNLFTQMDVEVGKYYLDVLCPTFNLFELRAVFTSFCNVEVLHAVAYDYLLETLGIDDSQYTKFLEYDEMCAKFDFLQDYSVDTHLGVALSMAKFSAFAEGVQLYAMFAVLMSFMQRGLLKGMGQIVDWSSKDENLHAHTIIELTKLYVKEFLNDEEKEKFTMSVLKMANEIVKMEDKAIDLIFEKGEIEGISSRQLKQYVRYITDVRIEQLIQKKIFNIDKSPIKWMEETSSLTKFANFFDLTNTEYSRDTTKGKFFN